MTFYRATLVWGLRGLAAFIVAFAAYMFVEQSRMYSQMQPHLSAVEQAAFPSPLDDLPKIIAVVAAALLVILALSETLSLLKKQK